MAVTNSPRLGLPRWSEGTDLHPNRAEWDAQQGLLDDLVAIDVEVATYADRPSPKRGIYMWVIDEQRLYRATSTGWLTTAKIGGGGRGTQITIGATSAAVEGTSAFAARADHTHNLPLASATVDGAMAKADKAKLDTATSAATANAMVQRDSSGGSAFVSATASAAPSATNHLTRKDYVDAGDAARFPFGLNAGTGSANNILEPGQYYQASATPVTLANGYPIDGGAGSLLVYNFGAGSSNWKIQEWTDWGNRRKFLRATNGGAGAWSAWRELAGTETATSSADGLLSKADKTKLDGAAVAAVIDSLVLRDSSGRAQFNTPSAANDAANKSFTENTAAAAASAAVNAIPNATSSTDGLMPKADKSKLDGAVSTDTASRLVIRDSAGRARFKDPIAAQDASTKAYTDSTVNAIPTATSSVNGLMSSADKAKLDGSTSGNVSGRLVERDSSGKSSFAGVSLLSPSVYAADATRKDYVDAQDAKQVTAATALGSTNLDTVSTDGNYVQTSNASATTANNYPVGGTYAGLLVVSSYSSFTFQTYTVYNGSASYAGKTFTRTKYGSNWSSWREIAFADLATPSSDGLMPSADRAALNSATYNATPNTLVQRASNGFFSILEPTSASHPANKGYVDGLSPFTQAPNIGGGDLNNYKTPGDFFASAYSNPTNVPPGFGQGFYQANRGLLSVRPFGSTSFVTQTFVDSNDIVWTRNYVNSWTPWVQILNDLSVQSGRVSITPSAANTPTSARVNFKKAFPSGSEVIVSITPNTTVPGSTVTGWGVANQANTGFDAYVTRTNTTTTWLMWTAMVANQ